MKTLETCSACPEVTCVEWLNGRVAISNMVDFSEFDPETIADCPIRRAIKMEDLEDADKSGLMPTRLLGC
jgi:hypothetical protein